jgi:hypothetical protein
MNRTVTNKSALWITIIFIFSIGFYLSSQRTQIAEQKNLSTENNYSENQADKIDNSVKQKLADDFESAFLKQYTPLIGCENLENATKSNKCSQHIEQAKNDFKQQFIKNRGLPKETFEDLKLSFAD